MNSGRVLYELLGKNNAVEGVLLVEMLDPRRLRLEAFPGATAAQILGTGFTEKAAVYER